MQNQNKESLISLSIKDIKKLVSKILSRLTKYYLIFNQESTLFWRRIFDGDSKIRILLENEAIILFFNVVAAAIIGTIIGGLINHILSILAILNIITFLTIKMDWLEKLVKTLTKNNND